MAGVTDGKQRASDDIVECEWSVNVEQQHLHVALESESDSDSDSDSDSAASSINSTVNESRPS